MIVLVLLEAGVIILLIVKLALAKQDIKELQALAARLADKVVIKIGD